jgi:hypothetical protein
VQVDLYIKRDGRRREMLAKVHRAKAQRRSVDQRFR